LSYSVLTITNLSNTIYSSDPRLSRIKRIFPTSTNKLQAFLLIKSTSNKLQEPQPQTALFTNVTYQASRNSNNTSFQHFHLSSQSATNCKNVSLDQPSLQMIFIQHRQAAISPASRFHLSSQSASDCKNLKLKQSSLQMIFIQPQTIRQSATNRKSTSLKQSSLQIYFNQHQ